MSTSDSAPTGARHYAPPPGFGIGPIPGMPEPTPKPATPELSPREQLAMVLANATPEDLTRYQGNPADTVEQDGLPGEDPFPSFEFEEYQGPPDRPIPTPTTPRPSSMVDDTVEGPAQVWAKISDLARGKRLAIPQEEASNLWAVYTGRQGKLMFLVAPEDDLVPYLDGMKPCPVTIGGAPAYITITGEAQSIAGYARYAAAAATIGRLAYIRPPKTGHGWKDHWQEQAERALD